MKSYDPLLLQMPLFYNFSPKDLDSLRSCLSFRVRKYLKGEAIFLEDDEISQLGIILNGSVMIAKEDISGNRNIISTFSAGNLFGEAFAFSKQKRITVSVFSESDSEILFLDAEHLLTLCKELCPFHSQLIRNLMNEFAEKTILLNEKSICYLKKRFKTKCWHFFSAKQSDRAAAPYKFPLIVSNLPIICLLIAALFPPN
jgi:CRP-like cAMP-binding protein